MTHCPWCVTLPTRFETKIIVRSLVVGTAGARSTRRRFAAAQAVVAPAPVAARARATARVTPRLHRCDGFPSIGSCGGVQVKSSEPEREVRAAGAAPIVVIGTTRDPATPYKWAQALAKQLESAVLLTRDGDGHTGYNMGNDCVDEPIEGYLIDGDVPTKDKDCGS